MAAENWLVRQLVETGRLPLFCFLCALIAGFAFIRFSVRLIRAEVRWWPGNVKPGGMHIHHVVFGVVFMVVSGVALIAVGDAGLAVRSALAGVFGVGTALVLDEFALILHLRDVYWTEAGRTSVDAVFVAVAMVGLVLLGFTPLGVADWAEYRNDPTAGTLAVVLVLVLVQLVMAVVTLFKGKIWTGLLGLFFNPLLFVGVIRLSRPTAPWARWRYANNPKKLARARRREERWRHPVISAKIWLQELLSGRHDLPDSHDRS